MAFCAPLYQSSAKSSRREAEAVKNAKNSNPVNFSALSRPLPLCVVLFSVRRSAALGLFLAPLAPLPLGVMAFLRRQRPGGQAAK
jgi:hypothetical protein